MHRTHSYVYLYSDTFCVVKGIEKDGIRWFELASFCKAFDLPFTPSVVRPVPRRYFIVTRTESTPTTFISEEGIDFLFVSVMDYCQDKLQELKKKFSRF